MSILSKIFKKKVVLPPADLSVLKTDMHSHLIPGIDDGAQTIEDSLELLRAMQDLGFKKVITTPHIMSDHYKNTREIILKGLDDVRNAIAKDDELNIEIDAAAEYYLDENFIKKIKEKDLLTFGDNYVLFELAFMIEPPNIVDATFEMQLAGYKPVLAHAERYAYWYNNYEKYQDFVDKEILLQLNINSLVGYYSPITKKIADRMVDDGLFSFIGSDCHRIDHIAAMRDSLTEEHLHKILNSGKLLNHTL
ncbi:MAG: capsular biosynthesis protein [Flavobacteriales bacterium]|nr:MAG: capsular biosynthesis protein [Flavobacteriales bacterium]